MGLGPSARGRNANRSRHPRVDGKDSRTPRCTASRDKALGAAYAKVGERPPGKLGVLLCRSPKDPGKLEPFCGSERGVPSNGGRPRSRVSALTCTQVQGGLGRHLCRSGRHAGLALVCWVRRYLGLALQKCEYMPVYRGGFSLNLSSGKDAVCRKTDQTHPKPRYLAVGKS